MKVILCQDVENLGRAGDIVEVKRGFAQNFLIPKRLVLEALPENLRKFEIERKKKEKILKEEKERAEELALKLRGVSLTIPVEAKDDESLYGSVGASEIIKALEAEGINIDKKSVILEENIRNLGIYEIPIRLHPQVETKIKVWVVRK